MAPDGDGATSIEEERRLFYVAVTRARDRLYLCRANRAECAENPSRARQAWLPPRDPPELYEEREESARVAPQMDKVKAGAAGVLAAILGEGNGTGEIDPIKRPFVPRPRGR